MVQNRRFLSPLDAIMGKEGSKNRNDAEMCATASCDDKNNIQVEITKSDEEKDGDDRMQWGNPWQFFCTLLGYCVGLGNIWRFPYLCQKNGGGAFIFPFLIMLVLEGMPILLLELGIGQRLRAGSLGVWNMIHPNLGGIGLGSAVVAIVVGCYYNVIIAWCLYYLFNSFRGTLPWAECPDISSKLAANISNAVSSMSASDLLLTECDRSSETQYFWYRQTLDISGSIGEPEGIRWWMFLCLLASWILIYLIIMKGIESSGNVVYFTALFPYVVMTIFFIRGITLPGAGAGLAHMFYPKMEELLKPQVWMDAANQVFYSYGLAFGSMISFGSYNPTDKNCVKDVLLLSLCNASTAIYACAVIFAILGFKAQHLFDKCMESDVSLIMEVTDVWPDRNATTITSDEYSGLMASHTLNETNFYTQGHELKNCSLVSELNQAAEGTGLAFIVMADVFTKLPGAPFWSLLFFSMLLSLGIGSQIGIMEGFISTLFDMPMFKNVSKPILSAIACTFCFLVGLIFTTGAGEYFLTLFDSYGAMGLTLIALTEIMAVMYIYGHAQFTDDIEEMTGVRPGLYWQICWRFVSPALLATVLCTSVVMSFLNTPTYTAWNKYEAKVEKKEYPPFAIGLAFCLALASVVPIIVMAILRALKISKPNPTDYKVPMTRVDTNASTLPMFPNEYHDDMDDKSQSDESDGGIHCTEHSSDQMGEINSASNTESNRIKGNTTNDMKNLNEIHTVMNENVVNLIDP